MKILIIGLLLSSNIFAIEFEQFPDEETIYKPNFPKHKGWKQYLANSIYKTRTLSLTYDDGPHPTRTPKLLNILKKYDVKATFFVLASRINKSNEHIIKRIVNEGHQLASHDWKHTNNNSESKETYKKELSDSIIKIRNYTKDNTAYYRFPYGDYGRRKDYHHLNSMKEVSQELFGENCINFVFWDIDTSDWVSNMTPQNIVQSIKAHINGGIAYTHTKSGKSYVKKTYRITNPPEGGVVLMHDIHQRTVEATELFLEWATTQNVEFKALHEIKEYEYDNKLCELLQK